MKSSLLLLLDTRERAFEEERIQREGEREIDTIQSTRLTIRAIEFRCWCICFAPEKEQEPITMQIDTTHWQIRVRLVLHHCILVGA